ncbi:MAG: hypothetical protein IPK82_35705 [Polyangiaceae bacterium]|nr:hypothetical protein [Polyangiaceae bacterium]
MRSFQLSTRRAAFACAAFLLWLTPACDGDGSSGTEGGAAGATNSSATSGGSGGSPTTGGQGGTATGGTGGTVSSGGGGTTTGTGGVGGQAGTTSTGGQGGTGGSVGGAKLGAHGLSYYRLDDNSFTTIDSPPLSTQSTGSTLIVSTGRGNFFASSLPTDNKGNDPYQQLGQGHTYTLWGSSGTALYAFENALGGNNHVLTASTPPGDEITFAAVEVVNSTGIQDFQWVERLNGQPLTSLPVTTTGPATLVAFWWGDAGTQGDKVAIPNNGFTVIESIGMSGPLVQCFVAAKEVASAGTYDVTWDATPAQGAQLWLVAVQ